MIETVRFKNFKALRDVTMPLEPFTVLVGPNASGKTSVLEGLAYLHADDPWSLLQDARHPALLRSKGSDGDVEICIEGSWKGEKGSISLVATEPETDRWKQHVTFTYGGQRSHQAAPGAAPGAQDRAVLELMRPAIDLLRFDAVKLAQPAYSDALVPRIGPDGDGLAAVLADMLISRADDFRLIEQSLRAVIPSVERIRLERSPVRRSELQRITINGQTTTSTAEREYVGYRLVFDMRGAPGLPADAASEGTLITLGILTAVISHQGAHLVLIDDLERAVHPRALSDLIAQLRDLLARSPDLQIIATSHSPYLVDHCDPREVRLMIADAAGAVRWARLNAHPEFDRWREFMRPGEIWSMVGEEWVRDLGVRSHA
jgi:predicted ATPase